MPSELTSVLSLQVSPQVSLLLACAAAYLLGSVSFAVVASRLFGLADPRSYGSHNPGATNVLRSGNKIAALLALLGDASKGWLAVFLAQQYGWSGLSLGCIACAVFAGHLCSVFLRFKGGKGVATAAGILLALNLWLGLATLATWLLAAVVFRYSSLAALLAALASPFYALALGLPSATLLTVGLLACALIAKHQKNIRQLRAGSESKIGKG
ncbi:MAG: glycerol-3-phosphate 1-O-acyltransferase PlsY [Pseudomonadota bacterium]